MVISFAVRTNNVENKLLINEKGMQHLYYLVESSDHEYLENRPQPKPHFAAVQSAAAHLAPANIRGTRASLAGRPSMAPRQSAAGFQPLRNLNKAGRPSVLGAIGNKGFQRFALPQGRESLGSSSGDRSGESSGHGFEFDKDMEERVGVSTL